MSETKLPCPELAGLAAAEELLEKHGGSHQDYHAARERLAIFREVSERYITRSRACRLSTPTGTWCAHCRPYTAWSWTQGSPRSTVQAGRFRWVRPTCRQGPCCNRNFGAGPMVPGKT